MSIGAFGGLLVLLSNLLPSLALGAEPGDLDGNEGVSEEEEEDPAESEGGEACLSHDDCAPGFLCDQNLCRPLEAGECRKDADCADVNLYCEEETTRCRYYCTQDNQCGEGEYCDLESYRCLARPDGDSEGTDGEDFFCSGDAECLPEGYCDLTRHRCHPFCNDSRECAEGEICDQNRCVAENPGDEDAPWSVEEEVEIQEWEGYSEEELAEMHAERETSRETEAESGIFDCPPGQVCLDGDQESEKKSSSGCGPGTGPVSALVLFLLLLIGRTLLLPALRPTRRRGPGR